MTPKTIAIGRGDDNVVVIPKSNVSQNHARLTIDGDKLTIEDLGSTNGTAVGTMQRKVVKAEVTIDDVLYFGSTRLAVRAILGVAAEASMPVQAAAPTQSIAEPKANRQPVLVSFGGLINFARKRVGDLWLVLSGVAIILFAIGLLLPSTGKPAAQPPGADSSGIAIAGNHPQSPPGDVVQPDGQTHAANAHANNTEANNPKSADGSSFAVSDPQSPVLQSLDERLRRCIYIIYADNTANPYPIQLATAFAIDEKLAVTTASIVHLLDQNRGRTFDYIALYRPWDKKSVDIKRTVAHPRYLEAEQRHVVAEKELNALEESRNKDPRPAPESLIGIKAQAESLATLVLDLIELKTHHDLGLIESVQPFETWLELTNSTDRLRPSQKLELTGYPLDPDDLFLDFEQQAVPARRPCRLVEAIIQNDDGHRLWVTARAAIPFRGSLDRTTKWS